MRGSWATVGRGRKGEKGRERVIGKERVGWGVEEGERGIEEREKKGERMG